MGLSEGNGVKDEFMILSLHKWENYSDTDQIMEMLVTVRHEATELSFNWQLYLQRSSSVRVRARNVPSQQQNIGKTYENERKRRAKSKD